MTAALATVFAVFAVFAGNHFESEAYKYGKRRH
jgi:hypothetical protein